MPDDAAVAGNAQPQGLAAPGDALLAAPPDGTPSLGARLLGLGTITLIAFLYLAVASVLAPLLARLGYDLIDGTDPFLAQLQRPRLFPRQLALREVAADILRPTILALLVIGTAIRRDRKAWRLTLALDRSSAQGLPAVRLMLILLLWPIIHIVWVSATAEFFHYPISHGTRFSPFLSPAAVAASLVYLVLLAPAAEEVLMRGEVFAKARGYLRPLGTILFTAGLFALAHWTPAGLAQPVALLPLALTLGWLRWRSGRLWPCVALHGWSNLALLVYRLWPGAT